MKRIVVMTMAGAAACLLVGCGSKNESKDIITQRVVRVAPKEPIKMQAYTDERKVQWIGKEYHVAIHREACDSLPMVKDEMGQKFVDNVFTLSVTRKDGSVFYSRRFTKRDISGYIDDDYRKTGIFEGLVFDKVDGDWLQFAGSVGHPQTDEYIPLVIRLSRMGDLAIRKDSQMDTNADTDEDDV